MFVADGAIAVVENIRKSCGGSWNGELVGGGCGGASQAKDL